MTVPPLTDEEVAAYAVEAHARGDGPLIALVHEVQYYRVHARDGGAVPVAADAEVRRLQLVLRRVARELAALAALAQAHQN